jgi:glyoxylase-like metal-dependent hydrolase (beta-lactamase superfamily II)
MQTMVIFLCALCIAAGAIAQTNPAGAHTRPAAVQASPTLQLYPLTGDFTVFITWKPLNGTPFPSNGMYLVTTAGVVLFDSPWDTTQFQPLLDSIYSRHHKKVIMSISTHFHDDRTIGIDFLRCQVVATWSSEQTRELCRQHGNPQAEYVFSRDTVFTVGNYSFRTFYPGEGHTRDNIVIWFDKNKVLYGGCLVKSTEAHDLGYLADANVAEWPKSIRRVIQEFPAPRYIIPGHFGWGDNRSLQHTLTLLQN